MRRTEWLQEIRKMRFEEAYCGWQLGRLRQEEAARLAVGLRADISALYRPLRRGWAGRFDR
jgi:hypothetical protein